MPREPQVTLTLTEADTRWLLEYMDGPPNLDTQRRVREEIRRALAHGDRAREETTR